MFLDGDGGLGIGDWGLVIGPNPQSPIPNPQSPIPIFEIKIHFYIILKNIKDFIIKKIKRFKIYYFIFHY